MGKLKDQANSGVRWTALATATTTVFQFAQVAVLGRLLGPQTFGLMAMVVIVIQFGQLFSQMGLSEAIVQRKDITQQQLSSLYWLNVAFGVLVFGVVLLCTPLIATGFKTPALNSLVPVAAISLLISALGTQFRALLQKSLRFRALALAQVLSTLANFILSIVLALLGQGVWSLIWGSLAGAVIRTVIYIQSSYARTHRLLLWFRWQDVQSYLNFGLYRVAAMSLNFFTSNADKLLIGALLGPTPLGYYSIATQLSQQPVQRLNPVLTQVSFPIFSKIQDDTPRLKRGYLKMIGILMSINAPILLGLVGVASLFVPFMLGPEWQPAVPVVQAIAILALIRTLGNAGGSLVMARGRADWTFYWNAIVLLFVPPIIYLTSYWENIVYIAWTLVALNLLLMLGHYYVFIRPLIGRCFSDYLTVIGIPSLLAGIMCLLIMASSAALLPVLPNLWNLGINIGLGLIIYLALMYVFNRSTLKDLLEIIPPSFQSFLPMFIRQHF